MKSDSNVIQGDYLHSYSHDNLRVFLITHRLNVCVTTNFLKRDLEFRYYAYHQYPSIAARLSNNPCIFIAGLDFQNNLTFGLRPEHLAPIKIDELIMFLVITKSLISKGQSKSTGNKKEEQTNLGSNINILIDFAKSQEDINENLVKSLLKANKEFIGNTLHKIFLVNVSHPLIPSLHQPSERCWDTPALKNKVSLAKFLLSPPDHSFFRSYLFSSMIQRFYC